MPIGQKVVLIGGGHNALITAFYLAKGGFKPTVLERREYVGGGAITEEFHPGFKASTLSHTLGPLRADIARDLQLQKFDLHIIQPEPRLFTPSPDGRGLLFYNDTAKTVAALSHLPAKEGARYTEFAAALGKCLKSSAASLPSRRRPSIIRPPKISGIC
jgi:phytoene dehydrogenase-like protein